jgi:hypothetical protein
MEENEVDRRTGGPTKQEARGLVGLILGYRRCARTFDHGGMGDGNCRNYIAQEITFLIFAVLPDTVHHALLLINQHGKAGKGIVVGLSCFCEAREHISLLCSSSDPGLQACQTKPCIGLHDTSDIGIP